MFDIHISKDMQPGVCEVFSLSLAHSVEQGYRFDIVCGEGGGIDLKIRFHGIYPWVSIFSFSGENFREGVPDCVGAGGGRHGVC